MGAELANLLDHHQPTFTATPAPAAIRFDSADHRQPLTFTSCVTNVQHKSFEDLNKTNNHSSFCDDLMKVVTNEAEAEKKLCQSLNISTTPGQNSSNSGIFYAQPVDLLTSSSDDSYTTTSTTSSDSTQIENCPPPEKPPPPRPPLPLGYTSLPRNQTVSEELCPVQRSASFSYFAKDPQPKRSSASTVAIPAYPTPFDRYIARQIPTYGSIS